MILVVLVSMFRPSNIAEAHDAYFMNVLVDNGSFEYSSFILHDKVSKMSGESKHTEYALGDFTDLSSTGGTLSDVPTKIEKKEFSSLQLNGNPPMIFSFPSKQDGGHLAANKELWKATNHATATDYERAKLISDTLVGGLNGALATVYAGEPTKSLEELRERTNKLIAAVQGGKSVGPNNEWKVSKGRIKNQGLAKDGLGDADWITISKGTQKFEFPFQMIKGYNADSSTYKFAKSLKRGYEYSDDTKYLNWSNIAYQAWYSFDVNGHTTTNVNEIRRVGKLEESVVEMTENTLRGLRDVLGLYPMNDLVYNEGIRNSGYWHHGVMPSAWEDNMSKYYYVFLAVAYSIIMFAFAKMLIQRNLSIVNPAMRVSMMEGIQDLIVTSIALVFLMPLMDFILMMNYRIVDLFGALKTHGNTLSEVNNYSGFLGGVILQFFYFFVELWLNFTYIIRGIIIAIMMMMAPLFMVAIAMGGKWKMIFGNAVREFTGHVFMQSFHAFILAFLLQTSVMSRGVETAVTLFALITLTNFFRSLVFGNGGDLASKMGVSGAAGAVALGASAIKAGTNKRKEHNNRKESNDGGKSSSSESGSGESSGGGSSNPSGSEFSSGSRANMNNSSMTAGASGGAGSTEERGLGGGSLSEEGPYVGGSDGMTKSEAQTSANSSGSNNSGLKSALVTAAGAGYVATKLAGSAGYGMALGGEQGPAAFNRFHSGSEKPENGKKGSNKKGSSGEGTGTQSSGGQIDASNEFVGMTMEQPVRYDSSYIGADGTEEAAFDGDQLSDVGIVSARSDAGSQWMEYTPSSPYASQAQSYVDAYSSEDNSERLNLYHQGVSNARVNAQGNYEVLYGKKATDRMGFQSLNSSNENGRVRFEQTRRADQQAAPPAYFAGPKATSSTEPESTTNNEEIPRV